MAAGVAAASFSFLGVTPASAAVRPATGCDVSFPDWNETTLVVGPADLGDFDYATMYVKGQGYFAIEFTYNNTG